MRKNKKNHKKYGDDYQDELDVYQAVWVLGKQKGEEMPLDKDKLTKLLDAGRLGVDLLGEKEKVLVGQVSGEKISRKKIEEKVRVVVGFLLRGIEKDFESEIGSSDWKGLGEVERKSLTERLFKLKYGTFPDFFAMDLYRVVSGGS